MTYLPRALRIKHFHLVISLLSKSLAIIFLLHIAARGHLCGEYKLSLDIIFTAGYLHSIYKVSMRGKERVSRSLGIAHKCRLLIEGLVYLGYTLIA